MNFFRCFACCVAALCLFSACTARQGGPLSGLREKPEAVESVLQQYRKHADEAARERDAPLFVRASLRFGKEGDSRRVVLLLWKNAPDSASLNPVRLDVQAGMGAAVVKILRDDAHCLLYAPREARAWRHDGRERILFFHNGAPLPFEAHELAMLASGDFAEFFGVPPAEARRTRTGGFLFDLSSGERGGELELDPQGRPVRWTSPDKNRMLEFGYGTDGAARPERVEARDADGNHAVLLVKECARPATRYTPEQMELKMPEGTSVLPLKEMKRL
jgi:hypothetical protein